MFVADYSPGMSPAMPVLIEAPVWLEFREVPPQFFNEESLVRVAGIVGDPLYLHPSTANLTDLEVAKVFTIVNLSVPLPEAVNAQFESGEVVRVGVSCPWLPPTCSFCNETGHTLRRCPTAPVTCVSCNSTTHSTDICPRAKKVTENEAPDTEKDVPSTKHKQKKRKKTKKKPKGISVKDTRGKNSPKVAKDYLVVSPASSDSEEKTKKSVSGKRKKKKPVSSSDSELSSSSATESKGSEHQHEPSSSESESESEAEERAPVEQPVTINEFTQVLSKKQKRLLKKRKGKHPKPINH